MNGMTPVILIQKHKINCKFSSLVKWLKYYENIQDSVYSGDGIGVEVVDAGLRGHCMRWPDGLAHFILMSHILIGVPTATSVKVP